MPATYLAVGKNDSLKPSAIVLERRALDRVHDILHNDWRMPTRRLERLLLFVPLNDIACGEDVVVVEQLQCRLDFNEPGRRERVRPQRFYEVRIGMSGACGLDL
jgi:hypothetical protein